VFESIKWAGSLTEAESLQALVDTRSVTVNSTSCVFQRARKKVFWTMNFFNNFFSNLGIGTGFGCLYFLWL
jgi:hypothetical protein